MVETGGRFRYSRPDSNGVQRMFACSVMVGEYSRGHNNQLVPDVRDATKNLLYDSTVDNVSAPNMYVTYHDAQAYPDYLITFRQ